MEQRRRVSNKMVCLDLSRRTPMKLSTRLAKNFSATIRMRGADYYRRRRVRILQGSNSELLARVRGAEDYEVSLRWHANALESACSCPYFLDHDTPCKHLWAAVLAAEDLDYLSDATSAEKLTLNSDIGIEELHPPSRTAVKKTPSLPAQPAWRKQLAEVTSRSEANSERVDPWPVKREIVYVVDVPSTIAAGCLVLNLGSRDRKADGSYSAHRDLKLKRGQIELLPAAEDRELLALLAGGKQHYGWTYSDSYEPFSTSYKVSQTLAGIVLPLAIRTGRCYLRLNTASAGSSPLLWDEGTAWRFRLELQRRDSGGLAVAGVLVRDDERTELAAADLLLQGFVFANGCVAPLECTDFAWLRSLRKTGVIEAPKEEAEELLSTLLCAPDSPTLDVPEELRYETVALTPQPCVHISAATPKWGRMEKLQAKLSFDYEGRIAAAHDRTRGFYESESRRFLRRDPGAERAAANLLAELGGKYQPKNYVNPEPMWELAPSRLPRVVRTLVEAGWHVEAEGKVLRRPGGYSIAVSSGVDWFELHGQVEYGDTTAQLPALLEALRRRENMVLLDDGTYGILPDDWLRKLGFMAGMGTPENGHIRFRRSQAGLLDALLAAQPEARCDETFTRMRDELRQFKGVEPAQQPAGFAGQLRHYQREGLGWMNFLRRFSFGGCLADDMGVGKTAQVLALLETRRELRAAGKAIGQSLVVVPKSLVFNWKEEATRFTPQLRVLDYTGTARDGNSFADHDVVVTTYGTLRRDAGRLKDVEFDYVVLDEAQAVKNAGAETAKAIRLLRSAHRLALSGTPVENHLGELWSLFDFLNPGMLGAATVFKLAGGAARDPGKESRELLAHALRPFILRRTKEQVAPELPSKSEQTIYCEMEPAQRKLYNELRQHYRARLLKKIETDGLAKSKIQVLEALLRLRQAACHPGLIDKKRSGEPSAKLDVLLEQLREVLEEGHKALVFSQFTSLLAILRDRLDSSNVPYEYLDGATRNRQARVERFQNDPDCRLFLVSLKAGGLGLNLTAAEYVFLLDPWWNPAVEAQAVDRAHRIGQTRQVFAYRLIARDTVEEKVLELQKTKRDLAAAIIGADNSLIRDLRPQDLELLLS